MTFDQEVRLLTLVALLGENLAALKRRVDALEARMEKVLTVETSEERIQRVYGERY